MLRVCVCARVRVYMDPAVIWKACTDKVIKCCECLWKCCENHTSPLVPPLYPLTSSDTPSQRVQFILGTEEDAEHVAHELFTELDEICVKDGKDAEWKETARSESPLGAVGNNTRQ